MSEKPGKARIALSREALETIQMIITVYTDLTPPDFSFEPDPDAAKATFEAVIAEIDAACDAGLKTLAYDSAARRPRS